MENSDDTAHTGAIGGAPEALTSPKFRPTSEMVVQDWPKLAGYLGSQGFSFDPGETPRQFAGGLGNLNYLLQIDGRPLVLRRPPPGPIPPGANDMAREFKVLSALAPNWQLAPAPLVFCPERDILGAPFLIMEYRPGLIIGPRLPGNISATETGAKLSETLIHTLAELHTLDPNAIGLSEFGRPEGFLSRAVSGWTHRADLALDGAQRPPAMRDVIDWLTRQPIPDGDVTLLHNDFKLDNLVLDPETLKPRAVLDWDMGSRGDPLFDVATLLSYWSMAGDPPCMARLAQMPTAEPGFWSRRTALNAYAKTTGRNVSSFGFYRILTMFKLAVVFLQLEARGRSTGGSDTRLANLEGLGSELMDFTATLLADAATGDPAA